AMTVLAGVSPGRAAPSVAVSADFGTGQVLDGPVADRFETVCARLQTGGVATHAATIEWPGGVRGHDVLPLQYAGLAHLFGDIWRERPEIFDPALARQIETGLTLSGTEVAAAHQVSHRMRVTLRAALDRHGVIATPTTPCAAWPTEEDAPAEIGGLLAGPRDHAAFTPQANHAGVPALSLPCGTTAGGLPLGLQLIAPAGRDADLIALGLRLEPLLGETL
ncbi:MAG: amidase family protein, partial [Pseudomonadota bacterium]